MNVGFEDDSKEIEVYSHCKEQADLIFNDCDNELL